MLSRRTLQLYWPIHHHQGLLRCNLLLPIVPVSHKPLIRTLSSSELGPQALVHATELTLNSIHHFTHLPWWAVILGTTITLRACIALPLAVYQMKMVAKQELLLPRLKMLQEGTLRDAVVKCRRANLPHTEANRIFQKEAKKVAAKLFREEGCSPYKLYLLPLIQIPLWVMLSFSLRNMTGYFPTRPPYCAGSSESLALGGTLWFHDLTVVDPYYILPVLVTVTNLLNIELHSIGRMQVTRKRRIITNALRLLSIAGGYIGSQLPSAVVLYWVVSSTSALVQNLTTMLPRTRRLLGIPKVPSEKEQPFRYTLETIQLKTKIFLELQRKG